jgi:hypothetical protein
VLLLKGRLWAQFKDRGARAHLRKPFRSVTGLSPSQAHSESGYADCELFYLACAVGARPDDRTARDQLAIALDKRRPRTG